VSLRWSERIGAALSPAQLNAAVWARGWSREPAERTAIRCAAPAGGAARWMPAVEGLRGWLESRPSSRGAELQLVLSNRFVRYAVLPWCDGVVTRAEREAQARHLLRGTYGDAADQWHVRVGDTGHGEPALVCAVDRALIEAVQALAEGARVRLAAVQPLLMLAFNRFRREMGREACLLVLEPGALCCAVWNDGRWQTVQVSQVGPQGWDEALVERQIAVHALPPGMPVFLFDASGAAQPRREGQAYRQLAAAAPGGADWALALFAGQPA
jgi:hypothetical protein